MQAEAICHSLYEITPVSGGALAEAEESKREPSEARLGASGEPVSRLGGSYYTLHQTLGQIRGAEIRSSLVSSCETWARPRSCRPFL